MRADDILSQIDEALHDSAVGPDAMRSRPVEEPAKPQAQLWIAPVDTSVDGNGWQPLGTIDEADLHIDQTTIDTGGLRPDPVVAWGELCEYMARIQAERERRAREILEALMRVFRQMVVPAVEEAARNIQQAQESLKQAGVCDDRGRRLPPRDRPAWQSRYGPAHQPRRR